MKKLTQYLLLLILLLSGSVWANDLTVVFSDSIVPADSNDVRADTVYTDAMRLDPHLGRLQFYSKLVADGAKDDTDFTDDTFFVKLQKSVDSLAWTTFAEIDTFLDSDSGFSVLNLSTTDSVLGYWVRGELIHWDSVGSSEADSTLVNRDAPFYKKLWLYITQWAN